MEKKLLKELKKGEWFTLRPIEYPTENQVYIKGDYNRSAKRYECIKWNDINVFPLHKGTKEVYVGFTF